MEVSRVGEHHLAWGEGLVWDDRRGRLCFVDCATASIHWQGGPDGSTLDADGRLWAALLGGGQLACFGASGLEQTVPLPVVHPPTSPSAAPGSIGSTS
jgi:sugar lactone lactonase YvrE